MVKKNSKNRISKEEMYMRIAEAMAERSTCKRLQVGTVITDDKMWSIISMGYNGNYAGGPNGCDQEEVGNCGCLHSEMNALIKPGVGGHTVFITHSPCKMCAKAIVNAGLKKLYYRLDYRKDDGIRLLKKVGVEVVKLG